MTKSCSVISLRRFNSLLILCISHQTRLEEIVLKTSTFVIPIPVPTVAPAVQHLVAIFTSAPAYLTTTATTVSLLSIHARRTAASAWEARHV